jgi:hypothetical protein
MKKKAKAKSKPKKAAKKKSRPAPKKSRKPTRPIMGDEGGGTGPPG